MNVPPTRDPDNGGTDSPPPDGAPAAGTGGTVAAPADDGPLPWHAGEDHRTLRQVVGDVERWLADGEAVVAAEREFKARQRQGRLLRLDPDLLDLYFRLRRRQRRLDQKLRQVTEAVAALVRGEGQPA